MKTQINIDRELFMARNMLGPLGDDMKNLIYNVIENPTQETWSEAYCVIIGSDGQTTFWQAVVAIDPSFPRSAPNDNDNNTIWTRVPDSATLIQALNYATH